MIPSPRRALQEALLGRHGLRGFLLALLLLVLFALGLHRAAGDFLRRIVACILRARRKVPRGHEPPNRRSPDCRRVPPFVHYRPDPMIYSQEWLIGQGIGVTYDNPDIHLERGGVAVSSNDLEPDTEYVVRARIWNRSTDAPAVNVPVEFSSLAFGIGTAKTTLGVDHVDLPVKGMAGLPAVASVTWRTPPEPGHYCLQARIVWADDAEPGNDVGQENTDVRPLNSPEARFRFAVRNDTAAREVLRLEADGYELPELRPCGDRPRAPAESHARDAHPVPEGWTLELRPAEVALAPDEEREVEVHVVAPDDFEGRRSFNVHAFDGARLAGGVTLTVHGKAAD